MLDDDAAGDPTAGDLAAGDPEPVTPADYKAALRRYASGVTVVTTRIDGVDHAMTATAFSAVSLSPPLVLICVDIDARIHDALERSDTWGVSVLGATEEGKRASSYLATRGRPLEGQLDQFVIRRGVTGVALFENALARLVCRTENRIKAGDHSVIIGEVVTAESDHFGAEPLIHYEGDYRTTTTSA